MTLIVLYKPLISADEYFGAVCNNCKTNKHTGTSISYSKSTPISHNLTLAESHRIDFESHVRELPGIL
jgi:hypothetical protein